MTTVNILGATGLVGRHVVERLIDTPEISQINAIGRRQLGITHPKLNEVITPLESLTDFTHEISGDVLVLALGASMQSKGNYQQVDFEFGYTAAKIAKDNNISRCVAVSSAMASKNSLSKYLQTKARFEASLKNLAFENLLILRPGPLLGRKKERWQETLLNPIFGLLAYLSGGKRSVIAKVDAKNIARTICQFCVDEIPKAGIMSSHQINIAGNNSPK